MRKIATFLFAAAATALMADGSFAETPKSGGTLTYAVTA